MMESLSATRLWAGSGDWNETSLRTGIGRVVAISFAEGLGGSGSTGWGVRLGLP